MNLKFPATIFAEPFRRAAFAFSLIEVMLVVSLLSLIVFALMSVFSSTQTAFRASVTQTDVLEGGRAAVDLIASDLKLITPSDGHTYGYSSINCGITNFIATNGAVNFAVGIPYNFISQTLPGSQSNRMNSVQSVFILGRQNSEWQAVGYYVDVNSTLSIFPLYRFHATLSIQNDPVLLYNTFITTPVTNMSHVMDGVIHFSIKTFSPDGTFLNAIGTNRITSPLVFPCQVPADYFGISFYSNAVPASVELELGVLEDRSLQRAESRRGNYIAFTNYLAGLAGNIHLFRQHVTIPNVDPTAYK